MDQDAIRSPAHCLEMTVDMIRWTEMRSAALWAEEVERSAPKAIALAPDAWADTLNGVTWWVSPDIAKLVDHAQAVIPKPDGPISAEMIPSPTGIIWVHEAPFSWGATNCDRQLVAVSWQVATLGDQVVVVIVPWEDEPSARTPIPQIASALPVSSEAARMPAVPIAGPSGSGLGVAEGYWDRWIEGIWADEAPRYERTALAMWVLGQSRLPQSIESAPRALKRRRGRMQPQPPPWWGEIHVTTLRRAPMSPTGQRDDTESPYHHQWMVRGHWRWYATGPGRTNRELRWVTPHIKGPEGAPLIATDHVAKLIR